MPSEICCAEVILRGYLKSDQPLLLLQAGGLFDGRPTDFALTKLLFFEVINAQNPSYGADGSTALVKSSVEFLRQVRPDSAIAQSRHAASGSDCR